MVAAALLSSDRDDWCTPPVVLRLVSQVGPIVLDPCSNAGSIVRAVREYRLDRGEDGLRLPWRIGPGIVFCNPPYGDAIVPWARRMAAEGAAGAEIVGLPPARPDTDWWHQGIARAPAVCFWRGRLTFLGAPHPAPFPSALPYWGPHVERFVEVFGPYGWIVRSARPRP